MPDQFVSDLIRFLLTEVECHISCFVPRRFTICIFLKCRIDQQGDHKWWFSKSEKVVVPYFKVVSYFRRGWRVNSQVTLTANTLLLLSTIHVINRRPGNVAWTSFYKSLSSSSICVEWYLSSTEPKYNVNPSLAEKLIVSTNQTSSSWIKRNFLQHKKISFISGSATGRLAVVILRTPGCGALLANWNIVCYRPREINKD
jgi:hypothetical protein